MMTKRFPPRLQMTVRGVGRIHLAHGAKTYAEYRKRRACLEKLRDTGRLDILRAIKRRELTILQVYAADRAGRLGWVLADIILDRPLVATVEEWLTVVGKAPATRARYAVAWQTIVTAGHVRKAQTIRDLEAIPWQRWHDEWTQSAAHWMHMRRTVSKFLSDQLGKQHPFRHAVLGLIPAMTLRARKPDLPVGDFWRVANTLPEEWRACYVTLVATGMRIGEYLRCSDLHLHPHRHQIAVPGTKTAASSDTIPVDPAIWPYIRAAIPCPFSHWQLWDRWRRACQAVEITPTTLHDLRHCTGQWLTQAGRPEASVQAMLRHEDPNQTRQYTATVLKREDAEAMARILKGA